MKLNKIEISAIALTLAFVCFTAGFFTGRRKSVVITEFSTTEMSVKVPDAGTLDSPDAPSSGQTKSPPDVLTIQESPQNSPDSGTESEVQILQAPETSDDGFDPALKTQEDETFENPSVQESPEVSSEPPEDNTVTKTVSEDFSGKININTASLRELTSLPGIGDVLAGRIIEFRDSYGAFISIYEIKNVSGIGDKRFEAIKDLIYAG